MDKKTPIKTRGMGFKTFFIQVRINNLTHE
jgi:hypothetical protein